MAQTLESMRRRIESAEDLYAVVRVMKALAAANIRQSERAVESLAEYSRTIELGLQAILQNRPAGVALEAQAGRRWGVLVFGSDQGMCGSFNEQVASFAIEQIQGLDVAREDLTVLVVGARLVGRLDDAGFAPSAGFSQPSTVSGITSAVHGVLLKVDELRFQQGIDQFLLVHHRPTASTASWPSRLQLLPVDPDWLESLAARPWESRSLPTSSMEWPRLFSELIRQHLFVALFRAFAESLASENANRLASTHAAERNIQGHLSRLTLDFHQQRQQAITSEILDIVVGFETLAGKDRRASR